MNSRYQALMIGHGATVLLVGICVGYVLAFNLLGELRFWPIPGAWDIAIPGEPARWRAAHIGAITNALMLIAVALCLPVLKLQRSGERFVAWGLILSVWGNIGFFLSSALGASGRALSVGANRFGSGDALNNFGFLIAYPGAFITVAVLIIVIRRAFTAAAPAP